MSEMPPPVRVGDTARRLVDDQLMAAVQDGVLTLAEYDERAALLWQARTRTELDELVTDLPASVPARQAVATRPASSRAVEVDRRSPGVLARASRRVAGLAVPLAILGGVVVAGPDSSAVFGSSVEQVAAGADPVRVSTVFGSVTVVVPDDVRVDTSGMVVFGSLDCDAACDATSGEVVEVRGLGGFGSIEVRTQSEHEAAQEAERLEEIADERDDEDDD